MTDDNTKIEVDYDTLADKMTARMTEIAEKKSAQEAIEKQKASINSENEAKIAALEAKIDAITNQQAQTQSEQQPTKESFPDNTSTSSGSSNNDVPKTFFQKMSEESFDNVITEKGLNQVELHKMLMKNGYDELINS